MLSTLRLAVLNTKGGKENEDQFLFSKSTCCSKQCLHTQMTNDTRSWYYNMYLIDCNSTPGNIKQFIQTVKERVICSWNNIFPQKETTFRCNQKREHSTPIVSYSPKYQHVFSLNKIALDVISCLSLLYPPYNQ